MNIYTSYMANWRYFGECVPISIMAFTPKYFDGAVLSEAAPPKSLLSKYKQNEISLQEFQDEYRENLERVGYNLLISKILSMSQGKNVVLVCTCKNMLYCHRLVLAKFIEEYSGMKVQELPNSKNGIYQV